MKNKKILIDIGHPAHVHQFKYIYRELIKKGYKILFCSKNKEISLYLLEIYKLPHIMIGKPKKGILNKILNIPISCLKFLRILIQFKPDIIMSRGSIHTSWTSFLLCKNHISFADTEHTGLADILTVPFIDIKITANSYNKSLGKNHLRYSGNIELFYLHPNQYVPDESILKFLKINKNINYVIIRFVSWDAYHDFGHYGLSISDKIKIINNVAEYARVYISSESNLPAELEKYRIKIPCEKMHDALYFASLYVGDGGTMASEAAVLGTPAVYFNSLPLMGYLKEEKEASLLYRVNNRKEIIEITKKLLINDSLKKESTNLRNNFIRNKIDVTSFVVWFIENYPESLGIMKENPDYQYNFQ